MSSLQSVTERVDLSRNRLPPASVFLPRARQRNTAMKGILIRAATVVLGMSAYVAVGIALASAG
jgi:hypothetical protein